MSIGLVYHDAMTLVKIFYNVTEVQFMDKENKYDMWSGKQWYASPLFRRDMRPHC